MRAVELTPKGLAALERAWDPLSGGKLRTKYAGKPIPPSDSEILTLWDCGNDTYAIARKFFCPESEIANRLTHIRMRQRKEA